MESNTDDIKISGEKKGSNNIININKNNEDLKEKDILYSSIINKKINEKIYIPLEKGYIDKFLNNDKELICGYFTVHFPLQIFDNQTCTVMLEEEESDDKVRFEENEDDDEKERNDDQEEEDNE